jgi:hypothetical protein
MKVHGVSLLGCAFDHAPSGAGLCERACGLPRAVQQLHRGSGPGAYAKTQVNDPKLDIAAEYTTMRTQLVATQDWIVNELPGDGGELRVYTFDVNKRFADVILTAPQLSSFKTQLNALIATVA